MMVLLLLHNRSNGRHRAEIDIAQHIKLMSQVLKHHTFNRDGSGDNCFAATDASNQTQRQTADATQPITTAAGIIATLQLLLKNRPMAALVGEELLKFIHHARYEKPGHKQLSAVDTDRTMLARMVDLHHAVAEVFALRSEERRVGKECRSRWSP